MRCCVLLQGTLFSLHLSPLPVGGRGVTWVNFCWVCAAGISEPLPHYSQFLVNFVASYRHHLSHFWANDFPTQSPQKVQPHSSNAIENA